MNGVVESVKMHIVAYLEQRLIDTTKISTIATEARKVIAYYKGEKPAPFDKVDMPEYVCNPEQKNIANNSWHIKWCSTSEAAPKRGNKCCNHAPLGTQHSVCIDSGLASSCKLPFWRGNGDDLIIQKVLQVGCDGDPCPPKSDEFGRVAYNNFRCAIFTCGANHANDSDHSFLLTPVLPHEGDELGKRIEQTLLLIRFLHRVGLPAIRVCILKGARVDWHKESRSADVISRQAEIVKSNVLRRISGEEDKDIRQKVVFLPDIKDGAHEDKDIDFEIERAILQADLIVAFDGSTGNILGRVFTFLGGSTRLYSIPWFIHNRSWPVGEGAYKGYQWADPMTPLRRAIMWKILEEKILTEQPLEEPCHVA